MSNDEAREYVKRLSRLLRRTDKLRWMMYYLYLDGQTVKVAHGDQKLALELHDKGHELGTKPFPTREEAEAERLAWQARVDEAVQRTR